MMDSVPHTHHLLHKYRAIILVTMIVTATIMWINFTTARTPVVGRCITGVSSCTPSQARANDFYCNIDPIYLSPRAQDNRDELYGKSQGLAVMPFDPMLVNDDAGDWLATSNLWLFASTVGLVSLAVTISRLRRQTKILVLSLLITWCVLEYGRWTAGLTLAANLFSEPALPIELLPIAYLLPVGISSLMLASLNRKKWTFQRQAGENSVACGPQWSRSTGWCVRRPRAALLTALVTARRVTHSRDSSEVWAL